MTFNSLFNKNLLFCWSLLLQTVPNKNLFSMIRNCQQLQLKRVCRVTVHSYPAICRLAYTAHTRLIHGSNVRFAQASIRSDRLHTARLGTLTASGLNGSVRLYAINYKQKMAFHQLLRTKTFMFLHKYFHCIGIVKVMFNPLKTM